MKSTIPPGVGAALRERREELGLTLAEMAAATRIHRIYLVALEEENFQVLPGGAYGIGFLRIYARDLGLPIESLLGLPAPAAGGRRRIRLPALGGGKRFTLRFAAFGLLVLLVMSAAVFGIVTWQRKHREVITPQHEPVSPVQEAVIPPPPPPEAVRQSGPASAGREQPPVEPVVLQVLPASGAIVRIVPVAQGQLKVVLDGQEPRDYPLEAEQPLLWKVSTSLSCELSLPGSVRLWVGDTELTIGELSVFILVRNERTTGPAS